MFLFEEFKHPFYSAEGTIVGREYFVKSPYFSSLEFSIYSSSGEDQK